jgi:ABC-2 type transport system ATP-binding protein
LVPGTRAPTGLVGPGWGNGGHTDANKPSIESDGTVGVGPLRRAGYNVLTWDPRGFGASGGEATVDAPRSEARDVQALIDALVLLPEAKLDSPNDPRVGMSGASYGGGIQWVTAAIDSRVDAITPNASWHSVASSLYKDSVFKGGWGGVLCGTGTAQGVSTGLVNSGGAQAGSMDSHMYSACRTGLATGRLFDGDRAWLQDRGPGEEWMAKVRAPALIVHGTVDTLFTLDEAISNFRVLRSNGVPSRMMWFCGGHGICQTEPGIEGYVENAVLRWFARYLQGSLIDGTGPDFEWVDQLGAWHPQSGYPLASDGTMSGSGGGTLHLTAGDGSSSGTAVGATPAVNGVNVAVGPPDRGAALVGAPEVELEYSGAGTLPSSHAFAQVVDLDRDIVLGGQATPIPLTLDGKPHTIRRSLEPLAHVVAPSSSLELQIIPSTGVYGRQPATGTVELKRVSVTLPLGRDPAGSEPEPEPQPQPPACEPAFTPKSVKRRQDGTVRLRPRIRCGTQRLDLKVRITGGRRAWTGRTGERATIRVRQARKRLRARFTHAGRRWKVPVAISAG